MTNIEEIVYEANKMNIREELFNKVQENIVKEEFKYNDLKKIYEISFSEVINREKIKMS
jgi:hypothetical protein